jgi:hypothetical protein
MGHAQKLDKQLLIPPLTNGWVGFVAGVTETDVVVTEVDIGCCVVERE